MSENTTIKPLNWKAIVGEALRRRKSEKMTQREHAALANVSVPTMAAFERVDTSLSLSKAFDILRVVGMTYEPSKENLQDIFVRESFSRWNALNNELKDSAIRFPYGWARFDYYLEGELKHIEAKEFIKILNNIATDRYSGLPPFYCSETTVPKIINDNTVECRLKNHGDFWRATPSGRMFLIRGHQEDEIETFPAQSIFDTTLPIWRIGEILLHAERLATLLKRRENSDITIHFQASYTGLNGRVLRSWAMPDNINSQFITGRNALSNEVLLKAELSVYGLSGRLAEHLYSLTLDLYQTFGITEFPKNLIDTVVKRLFEYHEKYR